jgi:flagellar biosynthetic protein FliP
VEPVREFMFKQTRESDLALFVNLADDERPETQDDVSTFTLIPAFVISELKTAFQIGFMIYVPFIVIDMIVASTLMSMGMMMLPPVMISLPFKILLFVMVDGWHLLIKSLIVSFK